MTTTDVSDGGALRILGMSTLSWASIVVVALVISIWITTAFQHDPHEPPFLPISTISHLIGLAKHRLKYADHLALSNRKKFPDGFFTVNLLGQKIYLLSNPSVIIAVQKKSRILTGYELLVGLGIKLSGFKGKAKKLVLKDMKNPKIGSLSTDTHKSLYRTLGEGANLNNMKTDFFTRTFDSQQGLYEKVAEDATTIDMFQFLAETITKATTHMLWRENNPFESNATLWKDYQTFDNELGLILFYPFASQIARNGMNARKKIACLLTQYWRSGGSNDASLLEKQNYDIARRWGMSVDDIGFKSIAILVAALSNTMPAAYAVLSHICNDAELLSDIRSELDHLTVQVDNKAFIDYHSLRSKCPLLNSTIYEVLRILSIASTVRDVDETCTVTSESRQYVLKKGAKIIISGIVTHTSPEIYPDPHLFKPRRFLDVTCPETQMSGQFRAFGGGFHLCAGRFLAIDEIMATVGGLITRFDLQPVTTDGFKKSWTLPIREDSFTHILMPQPRGEVLVEVRRRRGHEDVQRIAQAV